VIAEFFKVFFQTLAVIFGILFWATAIAVPMFWCLFVMATPGWCAASLVWLIFCVAASIAAAETFG
jgi:hypothetical protein